MRQESSSSLGDRLAAAEAEVSRLAEALRAAGTSADAAAAAHASAVAERDARLAAQQATSAAQLEEARAGAARQLQEAASAHGASVKVRQLVLGYVFGFVGDGGEEVGRNICLRITGDRSDLRT